MRFMQADMQYPLWAAVIWAAANVVRWQRSRPVLGPLLHLWWEETRWGHRHAVPPAAHLLCFCATLAMQSSP